MNLRFSPNRRTILYEGHPAMTLGGRNLILNRHRSCLLCRGAYYHLVNIKNACLENASPFLLNPRLRG